MKNIAIYGAGGLGREIASIIKKLNKKNEVPIWNFLGFFDDGIEKGSMNEYGTILGGIVECNKWDNSLNLIIAIGNPRIVKSIAERITNSNITFPNLIVDSHVADEENYKIGKGNILLDAYLSVNVRLGDFNIMNGGVVLGHDVVVGNYNVFMPAVRIGGEVTIGESNLFGVTSCIIQQLKIGDGVTLAPGSVLMTPPKRNSLYIGVPAKILKY